MEKATFHFLVMQSFFNLQIPPLKQHKFETEYQFLIKNGLKICYKYFVHRGNLPIYCDPIVKIVTLETATGSTYNYFE